MGFVATIIVGVLAGWLAEKVMKVDMPTWQNLLLGLCGFANMWLAVFADTGVAMLCVLNSVRALYKK